MDTRNRSARALPRRSGQAGTVRTRQRAIDGNIAILRREKALNRIDHVRLMAAYNAAMNSKVYAAAQQLPASLLSADKKAFFGSILGTLNHVVNGDIIWLKRFAGHPADYPQLDAIRALPSPASLDAIRTDDIDKLWEFRRSLDQIIVDWAAAVSEGDLDHTLHYENSRGAFDKDFFGLLMHFFNHQTHHRGQASTLLSQEGIDIGVTDLLFWLPGQDGPTRVA
jgi:uncharacterized damage-inducible protein DinB